MGKPRRNRPDEVQTAAKLVTIVTGTPLPTAKEMLGDDPALLAKYEAAKAKEAARRLRKRP